jgi:hypothetical protein
VTLRVRTPAGQDELRFKFILRDSTDFNGIAHTASFDAGGAGEARDETVRLPFDAFVPTLFARTVPGATLNTRNVVGVQFALSKFEYDGCALEHRDPPSCAAREQARSPSAADVGWIAPATAVWPAQWLVPKLS